MFADDYAPTDSITYLNSEHVWIEYMPYPPDALRMMAEMTDPAFMAKVRMALMEAELSDSMLPLDMKGLPFLTIYLVLHLLILKLEIGRLLTKMRLMINMFW